jgi:hypothetical protein
LNRGTTEFEQPVLLIEGKKGILTIGDAHFVWMVDKSASLPVRTCARSMESTTNFRFVLRMAENIPHLVLAVSELTARTIAALAGFQLERSDKLSRETYPIATELSLIKILFV